jgi:hypothetical protein
MSLEKIQAAVEEAWSEAWKTDLKLRSQFRPDDPIGEVPPLPVKLDWTQGADPLTVTLIVIAAHAGVSVTKTVVLDTWRKILLPKLKRRWEPTEVPRRGRGKKFS